MGGGDGGGWVGCERQCFNEVHLKARWHQKAPRCLLKNVGHGMRMPSSLRLFRGAKAYAFFASRQRGVFCVIERGEVRRRDKKGVWRGERMCHREVLVFVAEKEEGIGIQKREEG